MIISAIKQRLNKLIQKEQPRFKKIYWWLGGSALGFVAIVMIFFPVFNDKLESESSIDKNIEAGARWQNNTTGVGWELLDNGTVFHMWNKYDDYYFNRSNGIQFSNHYEEYWTQNVLMLGYYTGDTWNLLYRTNELSGFNEQFENDSNYINVTLWKDLSYASYDFRLAIRYHLGKDDQDLTIVPYIKNLGINIPFQIGFGWEMKDIKINNTVADDWIRINETNYLLNQTLDIKYKNLSKDYHDYNETTGNWTNYTLPEPIFYLDNLNQSIFNKTLYLKWNHTLDYLVWVKSRVNQYNAPVTLFIRVGTLGVNQEKSTKMNWHDSDTLYERYTTGDDGYDSFYGANWKGQTFTVGNTGTNENHHVTSVKLRVFRAGSPGTVTVSIRATSAEKPTGNDLCVGTIDGNAFSTWNGGIWYEITFGNPVELSSSTMYAIIVRATAGDSSNCVKWRRDASSPTYSGGRWTYSSSSGASWYTMSAREGMFEEYGSTVGANNAPTLSGEVPANQSTGISTTPSLHVICTDADSDSMTVTWRSNSSGTWADFATNSTVSTGTNITQTNSNFTTELTKYYWSINCTDATDWVNETYYFTTEAAPSWHVVNNAISGTIYNTTHWSILDATINGTIWNTTGNWQVIDNTINGIIYNNTHWYADTTINGTIYNNTHWYPDTGINGTIYNTTGNWHVTDSTINGTIWNVTVKLWHILDNTINGTIYNTTGNWQVIDNTINGTIYNTTGTWQTLDATINGTIWNVSTPADIIFSDEYPSNNSWEIPHQPNTFVTINHTSGYTMNITIYYGNGSGNCTNLYGNNTNITNGTIDHLFLNAIAHGTTYYWRVQVNDGYAYCNETFLFTTESNINIIQTPGFEILTFILACLGVIIILNLRRKKNDR